MPYSFSGPQRNGEDYSMFCSLQTLIDLAFIQIATGETLLLGNITSSSPLAFISNLKWVSDVKLRVLSHDLVNPWTSLRKDKRGP